MNTKRYRIAYHPAPGPVRENTEILADGLEGPEARFVAARLAEHGMRCSVRYGSRKFRCFAAEVDDALDEFYGV